MRVLVLFQKNHNYCFQQTRFVVTFSMLRLQFDVTEHKSPGSVRPPGIPLVPALMTSRTVTDTTSPIISRQYQTVDYEPESDVTVNTDTSALRLTRRTGKPALSLPGNVGVPVTTRHSPQKRIHHVSCRASSHKPLRAFI